MSHAYLVQHNAARLVYGNEFHTKAFDDVKITPTTYVINRKGEIIKTYVGEPDFAALHQLIEKSLAEKV